MTVTDPDRSGLILEALAAYGKQEISPVYLDTLVMVKSVRDEDSAEMLQLIRERSAPEEWPGIAAALRKTKAALEVDIPRLKEYFPTFSEEQMERLEGRGETGRSSSLLGATASKGVVEGS